MDDVDDDGAAAVAAAAGDDGGIHCSDQWNRRHRWPDRYRISIQSCVVAVAAGMLLFVWI